MIRLRGPWHYAPLARTVLGPDGVSIEETGELPSPGRCHMPGDWSATLGNEFRGRVRYERRFGRPTGLTADDRVLLVVGQVDTWAHVTLNETHLGEIRDGTQDVAFDVGSCLEKRNRLQIDVELPRVTPESPPLQRYGRNGLAGGLVGEVRLEIYASGATQK